ncbi:M4 family metallopeptidase [bacterium]|nr:M4 family metallopeptidase [bacterium]
MKKFLLVFILIVISAVTLKGSPEITNWADFVSQEGNLWSVRFSERGTIVSLYGIGRSRAATASDAAWRFLKQHYKLLGIQSLSDLRLLTTEQTSLGTHFRYKQYYGGLPIARSETSIHVNKRNQIIAANSQYFNLKGNIGVVGNPAEAYANIKRIFGHGAWILNTGLTVFPFGTEPRLAWRIEVETQNAQSWLLYVDAANPRIILQASKTFLQAEGVANVWTENPVVTSERTNQRLLYMDATKALSGQFVRTYNANFKQNVLDVVIPSITLSKFSTAKRPDRKYNFSEVDARLSEAMAYYHINRVHDHWRSVGFHGLDARAPVFVNIQTVQGAGWDNAQYLRSSQFPKTGVFIFGAGQKFNNFGLDGDVYYHEYGHGVLDRIVPGMLESVESVYPLAFHEGFADISACSVTGNSRMGEFASINKASGKWEGRNLENKNRYPANVTAPVIKIPEPHYTGLIAGGAWWDLQKQIGLQKAHQILYQSLQLLPSEMNFFDLRDAMSAADESLNNGANGIANSNAFAKHGIKGPNKGQKGVLRFQGLKVAGGPQNQDAQIKTTFQRGDIIYLIAEYDASGLSPGYNLVPIAFLFSTPLSSNAGALPLISGLTNGSHHGLKGAHLYEVDTDSDTTPGMYTFTLGGRLGGTNQTFPITSVSFTLN